MMNKHEVIAKAARDAFEGKRVLLCFPKGRIAREAFQAFKEVELEGIERKFRNTSGRMEVTFPQTDGKIIFLGVNSPGHRGMSVDSLYLPSKVKDEVKISLFPCTADSKTPHIEQFDAR